MGGGIIWLMERIKFIHKYDDIISNDNLLEAWKVFIKNKRNKKDVRLFEYDLIGNIQNIHSDLQNKTYSHGSYYSFNISDPKPRNIHKASVRDRLLHHAIYRQLYPFFDRIFISDSFSCRKFKGTHRALERFKIFGYKVSKNDTKTCWILKCDIKKFFDSIDHRILLSILDKYITDQSILWLLERIISSFHKNEANKGLPLGNLTSQLLVNVYMNEFDQFVKHKLKAKYYIRYADDFVFMSGDRDYLFKILKEVNIFLSQRLKLSLHPNKISIKTLASGVDFLGWVHFTDHRVIRTTTKRRMFNKISESGGRKEIVNSYLGMLGWGNCRKLQYKIKK